MDESPVLLHVWSVDPEEAATLVERLGDIFRHLGADPGFVSGRILASDDRTSVAALVEMRSSEDRQRLERLPEVRDALEHLHGAYNLVIRLYHEVPA